MSSWPLISDFSRVLQSPKIAFRDLELRKCTVETNNLGQPRARSGNFATVYRGYGEDKTEFAIRVFNRRAGQRRERYQKVSDYLLNRSVASIVGFKYDEQGIRSASDGKLYPLVTMDWVPGVTLFEWARDRSQEEYHEALAIGADVWLQLVRHLVDNGIVHGDLQHGNILVSAEGYFKLVDYDCLAVPELMGLPNVEIGLVPYQHPARNAETYLFAGLDNFSALVIYVALRALAAAPILWKTYVEEPGYGKLLFRKEDFADPASSRLHYDLMHSPDEQVRDLTHYLFQLTSYDLYNVPPVDEVLLWCNSLDQLLSQRDWDTAVQLVQRMGAGEQIPHKLLPMVDEAHRRVACRQALEAAIQGGDETEIQRCYVPELLDDYAAAAPLVEQARQAVQIGRILNELKAAKQQQNWRQFVQIWQTNSRLLANRDSAQIYREEMVKITRTENLRRLLTSGDASDRSIADAWNSLQSLGGHPLAEPFRTEMERRLARQNDLMAFRALLERAPANPTVDYDKQISDAAEFIKWSEIKQPGNLRSSCQEAQKRLRQLNKAIAASKKCTLAGEKFIVAAARDLPSTYHPVLRRRAAEAKERLKAFHRLEDALQDPSSDLEIGEAWKALQKTKGQKLVPEDVNWRIRLAAERVPLIKALKLIDWNLPPQELDERILKIWNETLLNSCRDARRWFALYEGARRRQAVADKIEEALARDDLDAIATLAAEECLEDCSLPSNLVDRIEELKGRIEKTKESRRQAIIAALLDNNRAQFFDLFDAQAVGEIGSQFPHHQGVLSRWTESEILPLERCGLTPLAEGNLEQIDESHYLVRWNWPPGKITDRCILAVCPQPPTAHSNPESVTSVFRQSVERAAWNADQPGQPVEIEPQWQNHGVYVWAVVDLGFQVFYSQPLELGRVLSGRRRRWGLFG